MIQFIKISKQKPYIKFAEEYLRAIDNNQEYIEAISISSYDTKHKFVDSRYVNLKFIEGEKFIFFSNYNSPKSQQFGDFNQISATFFWNKTYTQIRMRANIKRTSKAFNKKYFKTRSVDKNALAISSMQSQKIKSYKLVKENYHQIKTNNNLADCPSYWGGFEFIPFYFEFWKGNKNRLNKRKVFELDKMSWKEYYLQP